MFCYFVLHYVTRNTLNLRGISKQLKNILNCLGFYPPPKLALGPRGQELRIDIFEYPNTTSANFIKFGTISIKQVVSTGLCFEFHKKNS